MKLKSPNPTCLPRTTPWSDGSAPTSYSPWGGWGTGPAVRTRLSSPYCTLWDPRATRGSWALEMGESKLRCVLSGMHWIWKNVKCFFVDYTWNDNIFDIQCWLKYVIKKIFSLHVSLLGLSFTKDHKLSSFNSRGGLPLVLLARSPRSRFQQDWFLQRLGGKGLSSPLSLACRRPSFPWVSSHPLPSMRVCLCPNFFIIRPTVILH